MSEETSGLLSEECMFWESVRPAASTKIEMYQMPLLTPSVIRATFELAAAASDTPFDTKVA